HLYRAASLKNLRLQLRLDACEEELQKLRIEQPLLLAINMLDKHELVTLRIQALEKQMDSDRGEMERIKDYLKQCPSSTDAMSLMPRPEKNAQLAVEEEKRRIQELKQKQ